MTATHPPKLRRLVDFCCDRTGLGCGHHFDAHGFGHACKVPDCDCSAWRDHTFCGHGEQDAASPLAQVKRLRAVMTDVSRRLQEQADYACHPDHNAMVEFARELREASR